MNCHFPSVVSYVFRLLLASFLSIAMYGSAGAAHPSLAEASSSSTTLRMQPAADVPHRAVALDAAKLLLGNLWRADDVYFEALKGDNGTYKANFVSPGIERLLGVSPEAALAAWRGCSDALEGGVHSQARPLPVLTLALPWTTTSRFRTPRCSQPASPRLASLVHILRMRHGWTVTRGAASTVRADWDWPHVMPRLEAADPADWHPIEFRLRCPGSSSEYVDVEATFIVKDGAVSGVLRSVGAELETEAALKARIALAKRLLCLTLQRRSCFCRHRSNCARARSTFKPRLSC